MEITLEAIISLVTLCVGGTGLMGFFFWRQRKRKEEAEAKAAEAEANLKYEIVPIQKLIRIQLESGLRVASKIRE